LEEVSVAARENGADDRLDAGAKTKTNRPRKAHT
jgi:hypothetical protein